MMRIEHKGNYVLTHRKKAGLSQEELGRLIGYGGRSAVSRHEKSRSIPPLPIALCYEAIFGVPVSELFPGINLTVQQAVQTRLSKFEQDLQMKKAASSGAALRHAQKLAWIDERRAIAES